MKAVFELVILDKKSPYYQKTPPGSFATLFIEDRKTLKITPKVKKFFEREARFRKVKDYTIKAITHNAWKKGEKQ